MLGRLSDVLEEYGISVIFVDEAYTSSYCPLHGSKCGKRISRGLFKCTTLNKVFNADIVGAYNMLLRGISSIISARGCSLEPLALAKSRTLHSLRAGRRSVIIRYRP